MTDDLFFADDKEPTSKENVVAVIRKELAFDNNRSENLRAAAWFISPATLISTWVEACAEFGIPANSARNRLNEARKALREVERVMD